MNAPAFGAADQTVTAVLGPTNTGKTHYAVDRMLGRASGVMGFPLRLLAREVYDRVVALRGPDAAALITGEEKIVPPGARYFLCTVEAMPLDLQPDFVAIDEIQLCTDPDRGHVFTERLLSARGRYETLFLGSESMRPRIAALVPDTRFVGRERFSILSYAGARKISRLRPRTAVVAFSTDQVYAIAELIRRQRGGAAVVMGALSPRTRNAQVQLYADGDVDYIVATDAIGMGLNLDIDHVAFAGTQKFDGRRHRTLEAQEVAQIAGRAGRYTSDGTFGVTGEASTISEEVVDAVTSHRFTPVRRLMWRNPDLVFGSVPALINALEKAPEHRDLSRVRESEDLSTLRALWEDDGIRDRARGGPAVRRLWEVCQTPDFPKSGIEEHARLIGRIYQFLSDDAGVIPSDWFAGQVRRLDRVEGEIDTISRRLAQIRTWTYVANRSDWVADATEWRETTRAVEDRLSDALHEGLTRRFVDRRTSVLMRRLKQKERLVADVSDKGDVSVEGEFLGRIEGFLFRPDESGGSSEARALRSASLVALQSEFARRADKLYLSGDGEIDVTEQGGLMWGQDAVGKLVKGDDVLTPKVKVFVDEIAEPAVAEKVERRLTHWIARKVKALFEPMLAMRDDPAVTGLARGVAFQISEAMGVVPRRQISDDVKQLGQDERGLLRKHGVRFGQYSVFMPAMLKPAPTRLRLTLWSLWEGFDDFPVAPPAGHVTVPALEGAPQGYYERAGYRLCGQRAVRIDMMERLADLIRPMDQKAGFEATPDMLSITGCTLEQLADILKSLGFEAEKGERPRPVRSPKAEEAAVPEAEATTESAGADAASTETATGTETASEAEAQEVAAGEAVTGESAATESEAPAVEATEPAEEAPALSEAEPEQVPEAPAEEAKPAEATEEVPAETQAEPAGEQETEVFYIFRQKPRGARGPRREGGRGRSKPEGQRGTAEGQRPRRGKDGAGRGEGKGEDGGRGKKHGGKKHDGKKHGGPRRERDDRPKTYSSGPRERPVDPDSPFAILQQLKDKS